MYPIERYHFYQTGDKIIAVSTYAGKSVRGIAKCAESDNFDLEKGKKLAALRCAQKVSQKRLNRAYKKFKDADRMKDIILNHFKKMENYYLDAHAEKEEVQRQLDNLLESL